MHRSRILVSTIALLSACLGVGQESLMLPMEDGTKLATDFYLPEGASADSTAPAILVRSTYGRKGLDLSRFVDRGAAVVIQDVRGMGDSEGEPYVFYAEGWRPGMADGADTVAWIREQAWSNARVVSFGGSALAITQMLMAPSTDGLRGQVVEAVPANFYEVAYQGGVFRKSLMEGWFLGIGQPHVVDIYKQHPTYDAYWRWYDTLAEAPQITAPGFFVNGWYDIFQQGTIDGFLAREERGGEGAAGENYMIMRWSAHGPDYEAFYTFADNRHDIRISHLRNAFLDCKLFDDCGRLDREPKVRYYVLGADTPDAPGNEWREADAWPPLATTPVPLFLAPGDGLARQSPDEGGQRSFVFDPDKPFPTFGGQNLLQPAGPFDQRVVNKDRTDWIQFATAPLESPLEIVGQVTLRLWVSSDAPDTDFTAKLVDIYPEGDEREILLLDSVRRVKSRLGFDRFAPLLEGPEDVVELEIDLWNIAMIFERGHRIGVQISSSNYPRFEINPNTGADFPSADTPKQVATNSVHFGPETPSALILPVVGMEAR